MSDAWLNCRVLKGMFSDERAIVVETNSGTEYSSFVPKALVRGEINGQGQLRVSAFEKAGAWWAVIPNDYREIIAVQSSALETT